MKTKRVMSKKVLGGIVCSFNGEMGFRRGGLASKIFGDSSLEPRLLDKQTSFHEIAGKYGQKRNPLGWVTYYI